MPFEENIVLTKKETKPNETAIQWIIDKSAEETEVIAFWKDLRHFYRTGDIQKKYQAIDKESALLTLLANIEYDYPFVPDVAKEVSVEFNGQAPFQMLNILLEEYQKESRKKFKNRISELVIGLNKLLKVDNRSPESNELSNTYDFADAMIAFDKMAEIIPMHSGNALTETQLDRLKFAVTILSSAVSTYDEKVATVLIDDGVINSMKPDVVFNDHTNLLKQGKELFTQVEALFNSQMNAFTRLIKSYRIATLEIEDEYKEEIHDEYFEHFSWHRLYEDELNLFHPIVLIVSHSYVFENLSAFSRLLSLNLPIKIIVCNHELISKPGTQTSWEDASHQYRQEIASLAIAHRNVYTLQAGIDDPNFLYAALENCVKSTAPGVCHLSIPIGSSKDHATFQMIKAAADGRYFPKVVYDPFKQEERFDLSMNEQPDKNWPVYSLKVCEADKSEQLIEVTHTYADYKAMYPEKVKELMLIPSAFYTEHLVPLSTYLLLDEKEIYGKIPYIWLIDKAYHLHRAAIPNVWVVSCQERMDFWTFLQGLGGVNALRLKQAMTAKEEELQNTLEETKNQLSRSYEEKLEQLKKEAIDQATQRLLNVLLDDEDISVQSDLSQDTVETPKAIVEQPVEQEISTKVTDTQPELSSEPWVESENCTSCNECTDKYPNLFAYNDEKQAFIKDVNKGTYKELVQAAEKCPAACIHPGLPLNKKEPNLDKLIKRAAKFD